MGKYQDFLNGSEPAFEREDVRYYEDDHASAVGQGVPVNGEQFGINGSILMYAPQTPEEVEQIIRALRSREFAIVQLSGERPAASQRILDMLAGAVYALDGRMAVVTREQNVYLLTPSGVSITMPTQKK